MKTKTLIAYRCAGWGDCLLQFGNAWLWAKNNNCRLWIAAYDSKFLRNKNQNAFASFFDVPNEIEGVRIITNSYMAAIPFVIRIIARLFYKLKEFGLLRRSRIDDYVKLTNNIYFLCGCKGPHPDIKPFFDSLKLRSSLHLKVERYANRQFRGKKIIGLHIRSYPSHLVFSSHTKYWLDEMSSLRHICNSVREIQNEISDVDNQILFLCTDSLRVERFTKTHLENVIVYKTRIPRKSKTAERHDGLGVEEAESTLIEMFLLAKCDALIRYTESWFSHYASLYVNDVFYIPPPKIT